MPITRGALEGLALPSGPSGPGLGPPKNFCLLCGIISCKNKGNNEQICKIVIKRKIRANIQPIHTKNMKNKSMWLDPGCYISAVLYCALCLYGVSTQNEATSNHALLLRCNEFCIMLDHSTTQHGTALWNNECSELLLLFTRFVCQYVRIGLF